MTKNRREIECLHRLQELTHCMDDMLGFMLSESLINKDEIAAIKRSPDQMKLLQSHMSGLISNNKTQLIEYEWVLLPVERLKVLIITDRHSKEFSYNF